MTDIRISELPAATAVTADDLIPIVDSGVTRRATAAQMRTFIGAGVNVPHIANRWYMAHRGVITQGTAGATLMQLVPFTLTETLTINALGARVTTLFSGGLFGLAVYAHDPASGNPTGPAMAQAMGLDTTTVGCARRFCPRRCNCPWGCGGRPCCWTTRQRRSSRSR